MRTDAFQERSFLPSRDHQEARFGLQVLNNNEQPQHCHQHNTLFTVFSPENETVTKKWVDNQQRQKAPITKDTKHSIVEIMTHLHNPCIIDTLRQRQEVCVWG